MNVYDEYLDDKHNQSLEEDTIIKDSEIELIALNMLENLLLNKNIPHM